MRIWGWKLTLVPPLTSWLMRSPYFLGAKRAAAHLRVSTRNRATSQFSCVAVSAISIHSLKNLSACASRRKIHRWIGNHLKNPKRSRTERAVDLGKLGLGSGRGNKSRKRGGWEGGELDRMQAAYDAEFAAVAAAYMANEITQEERDAYYHAHDDFTPPWLVKLRNRLGLPEIAAKLMDMGDEVLRE